MKEQEDKSHATPVTLQYVSHNGLNSRGSNPSPNFLRDSEKGTKSNNNTKTSHSGLYNQMNDSASRMI